MYSFMKFADLHTHTTSSDGTTTPEEIVKLARDCGLSALAICDHDTIDGILPAQNAAGQSGLEVIPSLELSAENDNLEVHILGFLIECADASLLGKLKEIREDRVTRMYEMVDRLRALGVNIDINKVFEIAGEGTIGRMHLARILHLEGYVSTLQQAFYKYIAEGCPAYVSRFKLRPGQAIELILAARGVPVLAHPYSLNTNSRLRTDTQLIEEFVGYGLLGIEAYYPEHLSSVPRQYESIADKFNLIKTGGSDYHGIIKPQNPLGKVKVPYGVVEQLKDARAKLKI